ncbi:hypothetical protein [Falsibacillus pallidus]|uniref:Lipoprotein n=1 Tax=Falsibacillus pallidus TaxID=493781 RepID=A0A370G7F6_9BACI|nr:hypothetical protein [Falsibacillus pallidus]RDI39140.1 hypothetical protein DFR59_11547 [Falsibacillus pallidus]
MKKLALLLLVGCLITGCSQKDSKDERLSIMQSGSHVAIVEGEGLLAPRVCIQNNQQEKKTLEPFLISFDVSDKLKPFIKENYMQTLDSRNMVNEKDTDFSEAPPKGKTFCTGITMELKDLNSKEMKKMIEDGAIKASITELNGDVITSYSLTSPIIVH